MKIQLLNSSKLKIIFNKSDLDENNISLHSFLSGSLISQKFIKSIIEIAYEDFGFFLENNIFLYEIFSFDFSEFIIIVSKNSVNNSFSCNPKKLSSLKLTDTFSENSNLEYSSFKFNRHEILKNKNLFLFFNEFEDFLLFSEYIKNSITFKNINSILYKYENTFLLEITTANLLPTELKSFLSFVSEAKTLSCISDLTPIKFKEFAEILRSENALNL